MISRLPYYKTDYFYKAKSVAVFAVALFVSFSAHADTLTLAKKLFEEKTWSMCLRECERVLVSYPENSSAQTISAICRLRINKDRKAALDKLTSIAADRKIQPQIRNLAAAEAGKDFYETGDYRESFRLLTNCFYNTSDMEMAFQCATFIQNLIKKNKNLKTDNTSLIQQVETILYSKSFVPDKSTQKSKDKHIGIGSIIVTFYRKCISPAIGQRCSLEPSCSEYFLQASRKHGILSFPIQADRFVREPEVARKKKHPVKKGRIIKYADPLSDHDFWLEYTPRKEP